MSAKSENYKKNYKQNQTKKLRNRSKTNKSPFIKTHNKTKWKKHVEKILKQNKDYKFSKILSIAKKTYKL